MTPLQEKEAVLDTILAAHPKTLVAYSGGVDSAFLLWKSCRQPSSQALGILADSPSLPRSEYHHAISFAQAHHLPIEIIRTSEMEDERYRANPINRCYYCKHELFDQMHQIATTRNFPTLAYGENADDMADERPGRMAADEYRVLAPLRDAGLTKAEIRTLASAAGLDVSDKAASPCLSSRIPHGLEVTPHKLAQIEASETVLHEMGFRIIRVRHRGDEAFVQTSPEETPRLLSPVVRNEIEQKLKNLGFHLVLFDEHGYQGASLR